MGNQVPTQKSRWDDTGVEPPAGEARYVAGEQPIAEYDNWFNKAVVDDIAAIIVFLRNLGLTKIYQDVEENMPESGATTELFIATDTGKIYIGTGSGWRELTVDWNAILNKPSEFPPSPHQHDASEIVSGVLDVDRIPSLSRSKISDFFSAPFWDNIPDKPEVSSWQQIKSLLSSEGALNKAYDSDLDGKIDVDKITFVEGGFRDIAPEATVTESKTPASGQISDAFDYDANTYVEYQDGTHSITEAVRLDFGEIKSIKKLHCILGGLGVGLWGAFRIAVQVSEDGTSWVTVLDSGAMWSKSEKRFEAIKYNFNARYVRFLVGIGGGAGGGDVGALRIRTVRVWV